MCRLRGLASVEGRCQQHGLAPSRVTRLRDDSPPPQAAPKQTQNKANAALAYRSPLLRPASSAPLPTTPTRLPTAATNAHPACMDVGTAVCDDRPSSRVSRLVCCKRRTMERGGVRKGSKGVLEENAAGRRVRERRVVPVRVRRVRRREKRARRRLCVELEFEECGGPILEWE